MNVDVTSCIYTLESYPKFLHLVVEAFMKNCDSLIIIEQISIIGFEDSRLASEGLVDNL